MDDYVSKVLSDWNLSLLQNLFRFERNMPLFQLLCSTLVGRFILYEYSKTKTFSRKDLCRIVIENAINKTIGTLMPFSLNCTIFKEIVSDIKLLFPTEETDLFYDPSHNLNENNKRKRINSTGYLYTTYLNFRDRAVNLKLLDNTKKHNTKRRKSSECEEFDQFPLDLNILSQENPDDEKIAIETWKYSFYHRREIVYKNKSPLDILTRFDILKGSLGQRLILSDFEDLFKNHKYPKNDKFKNTCVKDRLVVKWPTVAPKLIEVAKRKAFDCGKVNSKRKDTNVNVNEGNFPEQNFVKYINTNYLDIKNVIEKNKDPQNDEHKNALAALLLVSLIQHTLKVSNCSTWKPNQTDIVNCFIVHIEVPEKEEYIHNFVYQRCLFFEARGVITVQPYIIICGPLTDISACYVAIEKVLHKCSTFVEAFDLCFKSFFALNLNYSLACPHIWSFIQRYIFEIKDYRAAVALRKISNLATELTKIAD